MKKQLVIEIDVPEGCDDQWNIDISGAQVFHDVFRVNALSYLLVKDSSFPNDEMKLASNRIDNSQRNIIMNTKVIGFIYRNEFVKL